MVEKAKIYPVKSIPDKLFFKIGEVCDLIDVQPHVLRYWESEFPMLTPQKNRAGQRTYRRKDVEVVVRIKQLLYDEGFTIAGAKKKLASELRGNSTKLKVVTPEIVELIPEVRVVEPTPIEIYKEEIYKEEIHKEDIVEVVAQLHSLREVISEPTNKTSKPIILSPEQKQALQQIKRDLHGLLTMLSRDAIIPGK